LRRCALFIGVSVGSQADRRLRVLQEPFQVQSTHQYCSDTNFRPWLWLKIVTLKILDNVVGTALDVSFRLIRVDELRVVFGAINRAD
jgi:hypothetical protein